MMEATAAASTSGYPPPRAHPGQDVGRPIRAAVLSNPEGGFNRRRDHLDRARRTAAELDTVHVEASHPDDIVAAVRRLDAEGVELLIVNGGDGTVQMALTALFAENRETAVPLLALLRGGTSNTIPRDVGWSRAPAEAMREVLCDARRGCLKGAIAHRPVLRVETSLWDRPKCAMQFSAGAIYHAITFAKREIESRGAHGQAGPLVTLGWFVFNVLSGRAAEIFPPMLVSGSIDGLPLPGGPHLGILVSTLDHLFLGIRPFWGEEAGRLRYSAMGYRPRRLALALWPALRGRPGRFLSLENGYTSHNGDFIELEIDAGFTLDGELFAAGSSTRIRISAPMVASFLRSGDG